jgi:tetratricopeptide (TPR) repeat protein
MGGRVAKLHVTIAYNGQIVEDRVLNIQESVRLGEAADAVLSFPGADILVSCVDGDISWRGRRLREGDRASLDMGPLRLRVEHIWPERLRYSSAFSGMDLAFLLVLLGVTVSGMWIDTLNRLGHNPARGEFLEQIGDFRQRSATEAAWQRNTERSSAVQGVEQLELAALPDDLWEGPRAYPDDARSGFGYYAWYRGAVAIPPVMIGNTGTSGLRDVDHAALADAAYAADNYEAALAHYQWLEARHPGTGRWLEGVALSQKRMGMHAQELQSTLALLERDPNHLVAMGNLAVVLARLGQMDKAEKALDDLKTHYPYQPFATQCEAIIFAIQGLEKEALGALDVLFAEYGALPGRLQDELKRDIALDPALSNLRADPRLRDLLLESLQDAPRPI